MRVVHLSYASDSRDAGIASALSDLISAQHDAQLFSDWLAVADIPLYMRDRFLLSSLLSQKYDVAHIHGLWRAPTRIASRLNKFNLPLVISPHGMLTKTALEISRKKKQIVWRLWERKALESASCFHALSQAEANFIRRLFPVNPIAVIPNCIRLPVFSNDRPVVPPPWASAIPQEDSVILYLGRFHPIKGLDPLLQAWKSVEHDAKKNGFWLVLIGYGDDGSLASRVSQAHNQGELSRVCVFGPVFGIEKHSALSSASSFVLPSFSEALPMAALEAMAYKLPVLLSTACNLPDAFSEGAALAAEPDPDVLAASLQRCFRLTATERKHMGVAGHTLVRQRYSFSQVASQTKALYSWLLSGGIAPDFVQQI